MTHAKIMQHFAIKRGVVLIDLARYKALLYYYRRKNIHGYDKKKFYHKKNDLDRSDNIINFTYIFL